ncbi:MAG: beta-ketoacyl synthase N-terminal-like domain-containing protein [Bacteroidota bacterium]
MLKSPVSITALASISPLGSSWDDIWESYLDERHFLSSTPFGNGQVWVSALDDKKRGAINELRYSDSKYRPLDDSVLFALFAARHAVANAGWGEGTDFGVNIGSSRGATSLFERYHQEFIEKKSTATLTSPTTTLGNISSWVAHDLKTGGPEISHSITCSTALHALLNGVAWLQSGLAEKFLVGGSEASLTPFTIAQMQALKIYSDSSLEYPCRALDFKKKQNTMVLGEGAAMACLERGQQQPALAEIVGIGYATEPLEHNVSISTDARCFQKSMKMAIDGQENDIDAIVMHAPGTVKGDLAEYNAIKAVFSNKLPVLTTNKWKVGHTFGASGMLSLEMAVLMLKHQRLITVPYLEAQRLPKKMEKIVVNAVGFGGNAVSILLKKT